MSECIARAAVCIAGAQMVLWKGKRETVLIDMHIHCRPPRYKDQWPVFVREFRRNGLALAITSSLGRWSRYPDSDEVRQGNAQARDFAAGSDGMVRWLAYLNPQNADWREELDRCLSEGAIGIKLWTAMKDEGGSLKHAGELIAYASRKDVPVLIHTYNRTEQCLPGEVTIEEFAELAEQAPAAVLIAAHAGGNWRHSLGVLRGRLENACVDISGSYPEKGMVEALVKDIGAERVLFGSDMLGRSLPSQIAKVLFADITEEEKEEILWKNAVRVFRLGAPATPSGEGPGLRSAAELPAADVDHFCFCGRWPLFETSCPTPAELEAVLAEHDIRTAYTGDLGSVYRLDLEAANRAFLRACEGCSRLAPLAIVNPRGHNWRRVLDNLGAGFAGVLVSPYLHNWQLDDRAHAEFFDICAGKAIPLWINCALGDHRFCHSGLGARLVSADEVLGFCRLAPRNAYVFQGLMSGHISQVLKKGPPLEGMKFEISRLTDNTGALESVLRGGGLPHLVMGSEFPLRDIRTVRWVARRQ